MNQTLRFEGPMSTELSEVAKASARGSFFLFLGKTSSTIIMAFASILVARLLGPENYGLYALAMITPSLLIAFSDLGISPALTMFSARFHSERKKIESGKEHRCFGEAGGASRG